MPFLKFIFFVTLLYAVRAIRAIPSPYGPCSFPLRDVSSILMCIVENVNLFTSVLLYQHRWHHMDFNKCRCVCVQ